LFSSIEKCTEFQLKSVPPKAKKMTKNVVKNFVF